VTHRHVSGKSGSSGSSGSSGNSAGRDEAHRRVGPLRLDAHHAPLGHALNEQTTLTCLLHKMSKQTNFFFCFAYLQQSGLDLWTVLYTRNERRHESRSAVQRQHIARSRGRDGYLGTAHRHFPTSKLLQQQQMIKAHKTNNLTNDYLFIFQNIIN
jgi:hypothetical protein